jgi:CBS domain-containing protein
MVRSIDSLQEALTRLDNRVGCLIVIDDGQLRGLLTRP